jgi:hypothetical protein
MKIKTLLGIFLILCIASTASLLPLASADTLAVADFKSESWGKTVDYFNYLRLHEAFTGKPIIPLGWHAWTYMTYINTTGFQLLYAGLQNVTFGSLFTITVPAQSILMHYKTENTSADVVTASSLLMLMAFQDNETAATSPNSPDLNDTLFASLSRGIDLTSVFGASTPPELSSKTKVFPLTRSDDGLRWSWGMQYTNLTAFWFRTWIDSDDPHFKSSWVALTRYDELTFTYNLTIDKDTHKATLTENHIIGRMRDLYFWDIVNGELLPALLHFNSTGCYRTFLGTKLDGYPTIYRWLEQNKIKMSIIQYQTTMMINHTTQSKSGTQSVTDKDLNVSNTDVSTTADTGEKVFDASFGAKATYKLYNYTADNTENTYSNYTAVTRTAKIRGFAFNAVIDDCMGFLRYVPYTLKDIDNTSYNYYKDHTVTLNVTGANYLYIISYPTYSGFRIVHDPTYTAYYAPTSEGTPLEPAKWGAIIVLAVIVVAIVLVVALVMRRRKPHEPRTLQPPQQ